MKTFSNNKESRDILAYEAMRILRTGKFSLQAASKYKVSPEVLQDLEIALYNIDLVQSADFVKEAFGIFEDETTLQKVLNHIADSMSKEDKLEDLTFSVNVPDHVQSPAI